MYFNFLLKRQYKLITVTAPEKGGLYFTVLSFGICCLNMYNLYVFLKISRMSVKYCPVNVSFFLFVFSAHYSKSTDFVVWEVSKILQQKAMATHSSTLAWKIPWMEEPGGLQSMGSRRVGHDWATSLSLFTFMHWRRTWQPTPVFLPGEFQGWQSLVGCHLWGRTESDMTEAT